MKARSVPVTLGAAGARRKFHNAVNLIRLAVRFCSSDPGGWKLFDMMQNYAIYPRIGETPDP